jgi:hypothetical protein
MELHYKEKKNCSPSVEIEIFPPHAEVHFRDERYCDPACTQMRFFTILHQSFRSSVNWRVIDEYGYPGKGSVDANGLYRAPDKGSLANGTTEFIVVSVKGYPFIQARATITLVGEGPEPKPVPKVTIFPKTVNLYKSDEYMDNSNSQQTFRADVFNTDSTSIIWKKNNTIISGAGNGMHYTYFFNDHDYIGVPILISAHLQQDTSVFASAVITPLHYSWPANN